MPTFAKSLLATAAGLALFGGISASANAQTGGVHEGPLASSCWGTKLETRFLNDPYSGRRVGRVELWYSPQDGGTNCAITYNNGAGTAHTETYLIVDDNRNRNNPNVFDPADRLSYDHGSYNSYAGASFRRDTNGKCVRFGGKVSSLQGWGNFDSRWMHCG